LHASHGPVHAPLQQYPSTQLLLWHWLAALHAAPLESFAVHVPPLQKLPAEQLASTVHIAGHAEPPPHTYGMHEGLPALPAGWLVQVPSAPGTLHALHAPAHDELQQ
jgi:hypothetical protein